MKKATCSALIVLFLLLLPSFAIFSSYSSAFQSRNQTQPSSSSVPSQIENLQPSFPAINAGPSNAKIPFELPTVLQESRVLGQLDPSVPLSVNILLPSRNPVGLGQFVSQVNDPSSLMYHHFLTPEQFSQKFGPSSAELFSLISYFSSKGVSAVQDPSNQFVLRTRGTVLNFEKSFQISFERFAYGSKTFFSPTTSPELPTQFGNIAFLQGLSNYNTTVQKAYPFYIIMQNRTILPSQTAGNFIYYSPSEMKEAYNLTALTNSGYSGAGVTIAIIDAYGDPYIQQELDNFSSEFHLQSTNVSVICVDGPCDYSQGISQGWNYEIALDVEWAHALAPAAKINLYIGSNSSQPLYDAVEKAVSDGVNSLISMSWGTPENDFGVSTPNAPVMGPNYPWLDLVFQQAVAEGITCITSSGDWGGYDAGFSQTSPFGTASYPSTDPYVTGVGGTTLYLNATSGYLQFPSSNATGSYGSETGWSWNNAYGWATGGGYSTFFPRPSYQQGEGLPPNGARGAPDVAWDADVQTGVAVSLFNPNTASYDYFIVGGTSVGSPSWSGSLAVLEQKYGSRLGFINPALYSVFNNKLEYSKAFHDVTIGNNDPYSAGQGWDPLTGIGSPNFGQLANFLAPSGKISVVASNTLSNQLSRSYSYGSTIGLYAKVTSVNPTSQTTAYANITSMSAQGSTLVASNVPFSFNPSTNLWQGSYSIKPSDPPGEWTATISVESGSLSGFGFTTFSVGGGITLFEPLYNTNNATFNSHFFQIGDKVKITADVTNPDGTCCSTSGNYNASFYLNTPSGKLEGSTPLNYNSAQNYWTGVFKIPQNVDQGPWVLVVSGVDSKGNKASAYYWINVGLNIQVITDSPNYVLGDRILIEALPTYETRNVAPNGTFTAKISEGSFSTTVPLYYYPLYNFWVGKYTTSQSRDSLGFYTISVYGKDTKGNYGNFSTVVRVAPFHLSVDASVPKREISVSNGSEPYVSARVSYPNGTALKEGSIEAGLYLDFGGGVTQLLRYIRLTYESSTQQFVATNILQSLGPDSTRLGQYDIIIQAYDADGNYGNSTVPFFVMGTSHQPISITSDSSFTHANGVVSGAGSVAFPYIIEGWNTTSISIGGAVTADYELLNNWVQNSSGNGISISSNSPVSQISADTVVSSSTDGVHVSSAGSVTIFSVEANENRGNGIFVQYGLNDNISASFASLNAEDGIRMETCTIPDLSFNFAVGNVNKGIDVLDSPDAIVDANELFYNYAGISIGASNPSFYYGNATVVANILFNNSLGVLVDGAGQVSTSVSSLRSAATIFGNIFLNNTEGISARNQAIFDADLNILGFNNVGISTQNSFPFVVNNFIAQNSEGVNITGQYGTKAFCTVTFLNSSVFSYQACIAENLFASNGVSQNSGAGLYLNDLNGSFIAFNNATGNFDGMKLQNIVNSDLIQNIASGNSYGIVLVGGTGDAVNNDTLSFNLFDGLLLNSTYADSVTLTRAFNNTLGCQGVCGGIDLVNSSANQIENNKAYNNTGPSVGTGILIGPGSSSNIVLGNLLTQNVAGLGFVNSGENLATRNSISQNRYAVYLVNGVENSYLGNTLSQNQQDLFPSKPILAIISPTNSSTVNGAVTVSWSLSGQSISNETMFIDGSKRSISPGATSYLWDTSKLSDGVHTFEIVVANSGGFSASSELSLLTDNVALNNHALTVEITDPGGFPISGGKVAVSNSSSSFDGTTDQNGLALFPHLAKGEYDVVASSNDSSASSRIYFSTNSTLVLTIPSVSTTAYANSSSGRVPIEIYGSIVAEEISNLKLNSTNGVFSLTFALNETGAGQATLSIPMSAVPRGLVPSVSIDGSTAPRQSFTTGKNNYYVTFSAPSGSHVVSIDFSSSPTQFMDVKLAIALIIVVALIFGTLVYVVSRRRNA